MLALPETVRLSVCDALALLAISQAFEPTEMGVELLAALWKSYPQNFKLDGALHLVGSHKVMDSIHDGESPSRIWYDWQEAVEKFKRVRAQYLLYP